jgi:hypothetical protein
MIMKPGQDLQANTKVFSDLRVKCSRFHGLESYKYRLRNDFLSSHPAGPYKPVHLNTAPENAFLTFLVPKFTYLPGH